MTRCLSALALTVLLMGAGGAMAEDAKKSSKDTVSFGNLRTVDRAAARTQAEAWLKGVGKTDDATMQAFNAIWADGDRAILDQVTATLILGDAEAKKLLEDVKNAQASAPVEVPSFMKDTKLPSFYRANLALAYAKALSARRVYEEALEALRSTRPEQVADPSAYLFHRAVAEHALLMSRDAEDSIVRLLDDVTDAPERYKMVAALMHFDMQTWKEKDLGWIARKMENIERRLDLSRGGPKTQKIQREVVMRLDEIIKELENQKNGQCNGNGGNCPNGNNGSKPNNNTRATRPQDDSRGGNGTGPGHVDQKVRQLAEQWGQLPEKERAKALLDLTHDMPPRYREAIESYFKKLNMDTAGK